MTQKPSMAKTRRRIRGASITEAMVSMAVFAVGIVGVIPMQLLSNVQNNMGKRHATASMIARDVIDTIEELPYNHPLLSSTPGANYRLPSFRDWPASPD